MMPRTHIILGAAGTFVLWMVFPSLGWYEIALFFLASFLIDFDHYMCAVQKTGKISLMAALKYHKMLLKQEERDYKRGRRKKGHFHVFHTVEVHLLILLLAYLIHPLFLFVFWGMAFHSISDFIMLIYDDRLYRREYFLINWIIKNYK